MSGGGPPGRRRLEGQAPAHRALTLEADLGRADQLDLGEARDQLARRIPPRAARRGRVHDDRHAGLGQQLRGIGQHAMDEILLGGVAQPTVQEKLLHRAQLEETHEGDALPQGPRHPLGERALAAARPAGDPVAQPTPSTAPPRPGGRASSPTSADRPVATSSTAVVSIVSSAASAGS